MPRTVVPVLTFLLSEVSLAAQLTGPIRDEISGEYEVVPAVREHDRRQGATRHTVDRRRDKRTAERAVDPAQSPSFMIVWPDRPSQSQYAF